VEKKEATAETAVAFAEVGRLQLVSARTGVKEQSSPVSKGLELVTPLDSLGLF